MSIYNKINDLNLAPEEFIVVGSGIMEALGIRPAVDLDIVVAPKTFQRLKRAGLKEGAKNGSELLSADGLEVWTSFDDKNLAQLMNYAEEIRGVNFINLEFARDWKMRKAREKDKRDLKLIADYQKR